MGRVYRQELYRKVVEEACSVLLTIALGTDLIVAFPEIDKEFDELYEFCRRWAFLMKRRTKTNQDSLCLVVTVV